MWSTLSMDPIDPAMLALIAESVNKHQCILFLGAAVHSPPPDGSPYAYPEEQRPPLGSAMARHLATKSQFAARYPNEGTDNLLRVAQDFEDKFKLSQLVSEIRALVDTGKEASPIVKALAQLDFPLVITTNYDQLYERVLLRDGKKPVFCVYNPVKGSVTDEYPGPDDPSPARPFIIKIHGDIDQPESLVVTGEHYIQFVLRMTENPGSHPVPMSVRSRLKNWPVLFIGYSLGDYNLRILIKALRWGTDLSKLAVSYAVDRNPDPIVRAVWEKENFIYIVRDIWSFVPQLYQAVKGAEMPK
jgi:SIR2-like protein